MKQMKDIAFGALGGLATALMLAAGSQGGFLSFVLFLLAPLPVYIATIGWGSRAGTAATIVTFVVLFTVISMMQQVASQVTAATGNAATVPGLADIFSDAFTFTLLFSLTAALLGHQINLARPSAEKPGELIWYPLPNILLMLAVLISVALLIGGYLSGITLEMLEAFWNELFAQLKLANPAMPEFSPQDMTAVVRFYARMTVFFIPSLLIFLHLGNFWLATMISRQSGLFARPKEPIAATLTLPIVAVFIAPLALLGMMAISGTLGLAFALIAGAFVTVLSLVGLAAIHHRLRNSNFGMIALILLYMLFFIIILPFYCLAIVGVFRVLQPRSTPPTSTH